MIKPQEKSQPIDESHDTDSPRELVRLGCILLRLLISWLTSSTAANIGRRIDYWSRATVIPHEGYGNLTAVQAVLNLSEEGAEDFVKRNNLPVKKPGKERLYRFADLTEKFTHPVDPKETLSA